MSNAYKIEMTETGGPEVLKRTEFEPRQPGPGEALVRQTAIGLNFIDTYHRTGLYPVRLPFVPGSEGAGVIEAVGDGVIDLKPGDRVAYIGSGTYATHYTGPAPTMVALPDEVSDQEAAALLLKGLTAWMLLFEVRRAMPGETALVFAPVGGVGSLLVPWATSLGVRVIAVTSSEAKADKAKSLGAAHSLLMSETVASEVRALTDGEGVDVSYDSVGKTSAPISLDSLKPRGWWVSYGNASGPADPVAPGVLGAKGSLVLTRPGLFHFISDPASLRRGAQALFGALRAGTLRAEIGQTFPLDAVAKAHMAIEGRQTVGASLLLP